MFGEHFVVYGLPAIASGINRFVKVKIEKNENNGIIFYDKVFDIVISFEKEREHILSRTFEKIFDYFNVRDIKITISGNIIPMAGMGYSAALAVAVIRALNNYTKRSLSDDEINKLAYECEKISHGTPSGIDNTCATYRKIIWFKKNENGKNVIEPLNLKHHILLVMGNTGKKGNTRELVESVKKRKNSEPEKYEKIFARAEEVVKEAKEMILSYDLKRLGELMNENHSLLQEIGVSSPELDKLCEIARNNGALGAKLTGSGGGGFMIALVKDEKTQEKVSKAMISEGFSTLKIKISSHV